MPERILDPVCLQSHRRLPVNSYGEGQAANGLHRDFSIPILETSTALYSSPLRCGQRLAKHLLVCPAPIHIALHFQAAKSRLEQTPINFRDGATTPTVALSISATRVAACTFAANGVIPAPKYASVIQIPVVPDVRFLGGVVKRTSWGADRTSLLRVYRKQSYSLASTTDVLSIRISVQLYSEKTPRPRPPHGIKESARVRFAHITDFEVSVLAVILPLDLRRRKLSLTFVFRSCPCLHPLQNVYASTSSEETL
ncbi:hypothetical protein TNCV_4689551 [Trichonephila clavipes]|nr:hypothetical protein TNCV_4689551 [Trichonephila clavipes]